MKKILILTLMLSACGSDDSKDTNNESPRIQSQAVANLAAVPACSADMEGALVYAKEESVFQYCEGGNWVTVENKSGPVYSEIVSCDWGEIDGFLVSMSIGIFPNGGMYVTGSLIKDGVAYENSKLWTPDQVGLGSVVVYVDTTRYSFDFDPDTIEQGETYKATVSSKVAECSVL